MIRAIKNHGFSLTEVLIAMAILTTGMVFIAGIFPAAIRLSTISAERVNASLAAEEAFAKIQLYAQGNPLDTGDDFDPGELSSLDNFSINDVRDGKESFAFIIDESVAVFKATEELDPNVFAYPSDDGRDIKDKQYFWSAVLRLAEPYDPIADNRPLVQVTVFICRKVRTGVKYYDPNEFYNSPFSPTADINYPMAVPIRVSWDSSKPDRLTIDNSNPGPGGEKIRTFINDGYTIVDDETGRIYRVTERLKGSSDDVIILDRNWNRWWWEWDNVQEKYLWKKDVTRDTDMRVWVVPPPANGNRRPCIAVYQRELKL